MANGSSDPPEKVAISFEESKNYFTAPVNGVWGGPTTDGELCASFYHERNSLPNLIEADVEDGIANVEQGERIARGDFVRELQATFVMRPETAISIGEWLIKRGQQLQGNERQNGHE
jgi:hypothetical protein